MDPNVCAALFAIFASQNVSRAHEQSISATHTRWTDANGQLCAYVDASDCFMVPDSPAIPQHNAPHTTYYQIIRIGFVGAVTAETLSEAAFLHAVNELQCDMLRIRAVIPTSDIAVEYTMSMPSGDVWIDRRGLSDASDVSDAFVALGMTRAVSECAFHLYGTNEPICQHVEYASIDTLRVRRVRQRPILFARGSAILTLGAIVDAESQPWSVNMDPLTADKHRKTRADQLFVMEMIAAAVNARVPLVVEWYEFGANEAIARGAWVDPIIRYIEVKVIYTRAFSNYHFTRCELDRALVQFLFPDELAWIAPVSATSLSHTIRPWNQRELVDSVRNRLTDPRKCSVVGENVYRLRDPWANHPNRAELWQIVLPPLEYLSVGSNLFIAPTASIDDILAALDAKRTRIATAQCIV